MSHSSRYRSVALVAAILCLIAVSTQAGRLYPADGFYYQTPTMIGGIPLVDIRLPPRSVDHAVPLRSQLDLCLARGIVAIGPLAVGMVAVGGGSAGIVSIGLLSFAAWSAIGVVGISCSRSIGVLAIGRRRTDVKTVEASRRESTAAARQ